MVSISYFVLAATNHWIWIGLALSETSSSYAYPKFHSKNKIDHVEKIEAFLPREELTTGHKINKQMLQGSLILPAAVSKLISSKIRKNNSEE